MKYKLVNGRCIALKNFSNVKKRDIGGFVEKESNLSQEGDCWVYDDATVYNYAKISDNAKVSNSAKVFGYAKVSGNARIMDNAEVSDYAEISGYARVSNSAKVSSYSKIQDHTVIRDFARVFGFAVVSDFAVVSGLASVGVNVSKSTVNVCGLRWNITRTDNHLKIGCVCRTFEEWKSLSDSGINNLNRYALAFYKENKKLIRSLI